MGFRTLAIQKKGSEVWKLLAATKVEFEKFGGLMAKVGKQVGTVQSTLKLVNSKTRTINRRLRVVEVLDTQAALVAGDEQEPSALASGCSRTPAPRIPRDECGFDWTISVFRRDLDHGYTLCIQPTFAVSVDIFRSLCDETLSHGTSLLPFPGSDSRPDIVWQTTANPCIRISHT